MAEAESMVRWEVSDSIAVITLDKPQTRNSVGLAAMRDAGDRLEESAARDDVRCIILTGADGAFCAGADLTGGGFGDEDSARLMMAAIARTIRLIAEVPVPVIAAVEGAAAGVGASFALASDLIVASSEAFFLLPFTGIGLIPDGGATATVAAAVGRPRAMRLALLRERFWAVDAHRAGLVSEVCEPGQALDIARRWAGGIAAGPRRAIAETKAAINGFCFADLGPALDLEARLQTELLGSAEFAEGAAAFKERRVPRFP